MKYKKVNGEVHLIEEMKVLTPEMECDDDFSETNTTMIFEYRD